jgi:hypothetical protein
VASPESCAALGQIPADTSLRVTAFRRAQSAAAGIEYQLDTLAHRLALDPRDKQLAQRHLVAAVHASQLLDAVQRRLDSGPTTVAACHALLAHAEALGSLASVLAELASGDAAERKRNERNAATGAGRRWG